MNKKSKALCAPRGTAKAKTTAAPDKLTHRRMHYCLHHMAQQIDALCKQLAAQRTRADSILKSCGETNSNKPPTPGRFLELLATALKDGTPVDCVSARKTHDGGVELAVQIQPSHVYVIRDTAVAVYANTAADD